MHAIQLLAKHGTYRFILAFLQALIPAIYKANPNGLIIADTRDIT